MTMTIDESTLPQVASELNRYVYMLVDPTDGVPFYVGKGQGLRFASHGHEAAWIEAVEASDEPPSDAEVEGGSAEDERHGKINKINEIRSRGDEPQIWIVRHGMTTELEYTAVEAAVIDVLLSMPVVGLRPDDPTRIPLRDGGLTNRRRELSRGYGIELLDDIVSAYAATPIDTNTPLLAITLGGWVDQEEDLPGGRHRVGYGYKREWRNAAERDRHIEEIAASAAGWWRIDAGRLGREGIEHVVVVHQGVSRALLKIRPGSWEHGEGGRKAFDYDIVTSGPLFDEIVGPHGRRLPPKQPGAMGVFTYWPKGIHVNE